MKKFLLPLACMACTSLYAQDVSTAHWMPQPITVDGIAAEWHQPLNFYDSETKLLFAISNDSTNIYLCFETKDNATAIKIMRAGMRVELDTKGRSGRSASIDYPLPPKEREEQEQPGGGGDGGGVQKDGDTTTQGAYGPRTFDPAVMHQRFLTNNITMDVKGFVDGNGVIPIRGRDINVAMNWDDAGNLFYELAIPIKALLEDGYTTDNILKEITLHTEVNAMKGGSGGSGMAGGRGGFGGGGGMRGGGMRGGGMRGGGMRGGGMQGGGMQGDGRGEMFQKTSFKQKFVLGTSTQQ